jgi:hypothetical protein
VSFAISYTGPRPVQTLSDFEDRRMPPQVQPNWLSSQPDSSPVGETQMMPGRACNKPEALSPTSQKSIALGTRLVACTTSLTPSTTSH